MTSPTVTSPTAPSTAIADAARQATDLAMVAGPLAVWDPNRPDQVHVARVGAGVVCTVLRGTPADRQPGGHLPLGVDWCWEPAADNPPNCPACLGQPEQLADRPMARQSIADSDAAIQLQRRPPRSLHLPAPPAFGRNPFAPTR